MRTNVANVFLDLPSRIEVVDDCIHLYIPVPDGDVDRVVRRFREYAGSLVFCYTYTIDRTLQITFKLSCLVSSLTLRRPVCKNNRYLYENLKPRTPQTSSEEK